MNWVLLGVCCVVFAASLAGMAQEARADAALPTRSGVFVEGLFD